MFKARGSKWESFTFNPGLTWKLIDSVIKTNGCVYTCNKLKTPHYFCDMFHKLLSSIWCLPDRQGKCCAFHSNNRDTVITWACQISRTVDKHTDTCSQKKMFQKCQKMCVNVDSDFISVTKKLHIIEVTRFLHCI